MKSIIVGRDSNEITCALDDEALDTLISELKAYQKGKHEARFTVETIGNGIDLILIPFDIQDKRIQEFFEQKEEINLLKNSHKLD